MLESLSEEDQSSLAQQLTEKYRLNDLVEIGWDIRVGENYVALKKKASRSHLTGKAVFIPQGPNEYHFYSWIETPEGDKLRQHNRDNPTRFDVRRILLAHYEAYLEGSTNHREIREKFRKYHQ